MRITKILFAAFVVFLNAILFSSGASAASTEWQKSSPNDDSARIRLLSSFYVNENNDKQLMLGLEFELKNGWKIYGKDSNGIGLPPILDFSQSSNYNKHEIFWPQAKQIEEKIADQSFKYSIYENGVVLPIIVDLNDNSEEAKIHLKVDYGLCREICLPATNEFTINITDETDLAALESIQKFTDKKIVETKKIQGQKKSVTFIVAFISALLGGLVLNFMPCVLPVLGVKLTSIIAHHNTKTANIRFAFISSILGIMACFSIFAAFSAIIGHTGNIFNWGLQFQNPYFLIFLILLVLGFIANMLGAFEINFDNFTINFLNHKIAEKENHKIFIPNFLSGILAVLLATPCSAPFLGIAISYAVTQSANISFMVFLAIGLGFSIPYIIFSISPKLVYRLPKSGKLMYLVKKIMIILLIITVLWLLYILSSNISIIAGAGGIFISLLLMASFKINKQKYKYLSILILTILMFFLPFFFKKNYSPDSHPDQIWREFNEAELQKLVEEGNVVVVDITADWCLTCKFNKINVLHDKEIIDRLTKPYIIAMRADFTKRNRDVLSFINRQGRYAIPFNAVYGPNAKNGLLTNELLTKTELLDLIDRASPVTSPNEQIIENE